jgi:hypothetical protein
MSRGGRTAGFVAVVLSCGWLQVAVRRNLFEAAPARGMFAVAAALGVALIFGLLNRSRPDGEPHKWAFALSVTVFVVAVLSTVVAALLARGGLVLGEGVRGAVGVSAVVGGVTGIVIAVRLRPWSA